MFNRQLPPTPGESHNLHQLVLSLQPGFELPHLYECQDLEDQWLPGDTFYYEQVANWEDYRKLLEIQYDIADEDFIDF